MSPKSAIQALTSPILSLWWLGLMFCIPFTVAYHYIPIPAFYGEWITACLGLVAMLALFAKANWQPVQLPQIALVFLGLAGILGMQFVVGLLQSAQYALLVLSYLAWAFLLAVLGQYLRRTLGLEKLSITLAWFLVISALVNLVFVALQIAQKSGIPISFLPEFPSYGALAQRNNFADFMGLATASLMYLYAKERLNIKFFGLGLLLFVTLLAFSGSRSSWLYMVLLTLLGVYLHFNAIKQANQSQQTKRLFKASLVLIPMFVLIQFLLGQFLPDSLIDLPTERISDAIDSKSSSLRAQFWQTGWYLFSQNPWLGIGAGQLRWQTFLLIDQPAHNPAQLIFEHTHNVFLHLFTEMGIGAGLLAIVGLASWAWVFKWRTLNLETWWLIALLSIIGLHSMLEYPLWYTYFLGVFAFLLGAGDEKTTHIKLSQAATGLLKGIFTLAMLLSCYSLITIQIAYEKLEYQLAIAGQSEFTSQQRATFTDEMIWINDHSLLAPYAHVILSSYSIPQTKLIENQLWLSNSALHFMPMPKLNVQQVILLEMKGQHAEAIAQLKRVIVAYKGGIVREVQQLTVPQQKIYQQLLLELQSSQPQPVK